MNLIFLNDFFFRKESKKLKRYERILEKVDGVFAVMTRGLFSVVVNIIFRLFEKKFNPNFKNPNAAHSSQNVHEHLKGYTYIHCIIYAHSHIVAKGPVLVRPTPIPLILRIWKLSMA